MTSVQMIWYKEAPNDLCKGILFFFVVSSAGRFYLSVLFCLIRPQKNDPESSLEKFHLQ
jgi:hypothetical protein